MSIVIPFAFALSNMLMDTWLSLLSVNRSTGFPREHAVCLMKWSNQALKLVFVIQPLLCSTPTVPGNALFSMKSLKCTCGKIRKAGIAFPCVFTSLFMVTRVIRSVEVTCPTCFTPVSGITFEGLCTVVSTVSSQLYIDLGSISLRTMTLSKFSKKSPTFFRLKLVARL